MATSMVGPMAGAGAGLELPSDGSAADSALNIQENRNRMKAKSKSKSKPKEVIKTKDPVISKETTSIINKAGSQSVGDSGSTTGDVGSMLMMSKNPYAMAAGGALKVIGAVGARKRKEEQARVASENSRRQRLMQAMGQLGTGVGSIGMA